MSSIPKIFSESKAKSDRSVPECVRCRNHGRKIPKKGHKRDCENKFCVCDKCKLLVARKEVEAEIKVLESKDKHQTNRQTNGKADRKAFNSDIKQFLNSESLELMESLCPKSFSGRSLIKSDFDMRGSDIKQIRFEKQSFVAHPALGIAKRSDIMEDRCKAISLLTPMSSFCQGPIAHTNYQPIQRELTDCKLNDNQGRNHCIENKDKRGFKSSYSIESILKSGQKELATNCDYMSKYISTSLSEIDIRVEPITDSNRQRLTLEYQKSVLTNCYSQSIRDSLFSREWLPIN